MYVTSSDGVTGELLDERRCIILSRGREVRGKKPLKPLTQSEYFARTTSFIQLLVSGGRHKTWASFTRTFKAADEAHDYLDFLLQDDPAERTEFGIKTPHYTVLSNYPTELIYADTPVRGRLEDIDHRITNGHKFVMPTRVPTIPATPAIPAAPTSSRAAPPPGDAAATIKLDHLCSKHSLDPKRVRRWLRHSGMPKRGTWVFTPDEAQRVVEGVKS